MHNITYLTLILKCNYDDLKNWLFIIITYTLLLEKTFDASLALKPVFKPKSTNKYLIINFTPVSCSKNPRQEIKSLEKH